jgi:glycosyltransferase involved in cell wall biosynthesis
VGDVPLTVLLPVYNGGAYLGKTIESILSQSYGDYELLILDDGSGDETPNVLQRYSQRDPRIRLLQHPNRGVGYTLNRGINEARGRLLAEIGADDLALPGRLQKQVDFLESNPDHVLVGGYLRIIDPLDRPIGLRTYPTSDAKLRERMLLYNPFASPSLMYRRVDALAVAGYTSRFSTSEDYDFLLRLARRGKVANLPEALTAYRLHPGQTKSKQTRRQLRDTVAIKRTAYAEYGYCETPLARAVNLAQDAMALLPAGVTYWLFTKLAIRGE